MTSTAFITIVYTARCDMVAPDAEGFSFGFDMSSDGVYTNAASDSVHLLTLKYLDDDQQEQPFSSEMCVFDMIAETEIVIPADQTLSFKWDADAQDYILDPADLTVTFLKPEVKADYFSDGGEVVVTLWKKVGADFVELTANDLADLDPSDDSLEIYASAVASATPHYEEAEAERVLVTIAPALTDAPVLALADSQHDDAAAQDETTLCVTANEGITYGATFALLSYEDEEFVSFPAPTAAAEYTFTYQKKVGADFTDVEFNPLAQALLPAGEYRVIIAPAATTKLAFEGPNGDPVYFLTVDLTVGKATITVTPYIDDLRAKTVTYGDAAPAATLSVTGIQETEESDIAAIRETIGASFDPAAPYAPLTSGVGSYNYTAVVASASLDNYSVEIASPAVLTVSAKALTLSVEYAGGRATFSVEGLLNGETPVYSVGESALEGDVYTANAADYGSALTASVLPATGAANYTAGELDLAAFYRVSFDKVKEAAVGEIADQYIFDDCFASAPQSAPTLDRFAFLGWKTEGANDYFAFESEAIEEDITIYADWEQMFYSFAFRALNAGAQANAPAFCLLWDGEQGAFTVATTEDNDGNTVAAVSNAVFDFRKGSLIPANVKIKGFSVDRWYAVVNGVRTETNFFSVAASAETDETAYYLAEMTFDLGKGDVNGDGKVTVLDVQAMRRYLVGSTFEVVTTEQAAWDLVFTGNDDGDYFYYLVWDVNGDESCDTRDILAIREALATGYGYQIVSNVTADGVYSSGEQIAAADAVCYDGKIRFAPNLEELGGLLYAGQRVRITTDIESSDDLEVVYDGDFFLDLGGNVLTAPSLTMTISGKITVLNGKLNIEDVILEGESITITGVLDCEDLPIEIAENATVFVWGE